MTTESDAFGSICAVKTLYNHKYSESSDHWSEFEDAVADDNRMKELTKAFAVIHRRSPVEKKGIIGWVTHSIQAQSPRLRDLLDDVFQDYPNWYPLAEAYSVRPPFKPYIHEWDKIKEAVERCDSETQNEWNLLRGELEHSLKPHVSALKEAKSTGLISFDSLWLILAPGSLMISSDTRSKSVYSLRAAELKKPEIGPRFWRLELTFIDWNGSYCGHRNMVLNIHHYPEPAWVTSLAVYPLEYAPNKAELTSKALARGRKFEALRGFHVKKCSGKKYQTNPRSGELTEKPVIGRIIVDAFSYYRFQNRGAPQLTRRIQIPKGVTLVETSSSSSGSSSTSLQSSDSEADAHMSKSKRFYGSSRKRLTESRREDLRPLSDLECILANPRVKGFDLGTKEWGEFNVDDILDAGWDLTPYENLVLPQDDKELVMAIADRSRLTKQESNDFVTSKGMGIIILLCGPPGVGKTLTAEAVAEKCEAPLYILGAGDLGTDAEKVEDSLAQALDRCQLWKAVLLLDEADVFLESRSPENLKRNELVSIFLRKLEYYRGLMFLTTNRLSSIDPAFESRLDLILPYFELSFDARKQLWKEFLGLRSKHETDVSESDLEELAKNNINGREIKNLIKTSRILAGKESLKLKHINTVLGVRKRVEDFKQHDSSKWNH